MFNSKIFNKQNCSVVFGTENDSNKYPIINKITAIYVAITLILQTSILIAPILTALSYTPLYHFKTYFGILGALLIVVDLFTNKVLWRGYGCYLWYIIFGILVLSSIRTVSYGVSDNLFNICWFVIEIALFYSLYYRFNPETFKKYVFIVTSILSFIWFVACVISICQFALNIKYTYLADTVTADKTQFTQGFAKNRLYGIFNPINHAAYVSLMLSLLGIYFITQSKNIYVKILYSIACISFVLHIVFCGSRSALVAIYLIIFVFTFLAVRNKFKVMNIKKFLFCTLCAIVSIAITFFSLATIKDIAELLPKTFSKTESTTNIDKNNTSNADVEENKFENILDRNIGDNPSNSRFQIWGDYLSTYKDIGLIGLSTGNYMKYMDENHSYLYIVDSIKKYHPEKYNAGIIYHVHNGYLMVFVSTGIIGFALFLIYLFLCLKRVFKYLFTASAIDSSIILLLSICLAGATAAMFDRGIFLSDNPQTFIFWIAIGALMKITHNKSIKEK